MTSIGYSIGTALRGQMVLSNSPGPAAYSAKKDPRETSPQWSLPQSQRSGFHPNESPGPGTYDSLYTKEAHKFNSPSWHIAGKYQQPSYLFQDIPGPGAYQPQLDSVIEAAPKFSMRKKPEGIKNTQNVPGPGQYDTNNSTLGNFPSMIFGRAQRKTLDNLDGSGETPGPGRYLNTQFISESPKFGFGTSKRPNINGKVSDHQQIGPGQYDMRSSIGLSGVGSTICGKWSYRDSQASLSPGPGRYSPEKEKILKQQPSYKFGKSLRSFSLNKGETVPLPGPGSYQPNLTLIQEKYPGMVFGTQKRASIGNLSQMPGPGQYDVVNQLNALQEGPKYSITPRRYDHSKEREEISKPGPNQYNVNTSLVYEGKNGVIIGTSKRTDFTKSGNVAPAPGSNGGFTFGRDPRSQFKLNDNPGPGAYQIQTTVGEMNDYIKVAGTPQRAGPTPIDYKYN